MSIYGSWVSATIAAGGTVSTAANLGKDYEYVQIMIPAQDAATIGLQVGIDPAASGTLTYQTLGISNVTASTTGSVTTTLELGGFQYVKVVSSAAQTAEETYYLRGYRL